MKEEFNFDPFLNVEFWPGAERSRAEIYSYLSSKPETFANVRISGYSSSFSQMHIKLWGDQYGSGDILILKGCSFMSGPFAWQDARLVMKIENDSDGSFIILTDETAEFSLWCGEIILLREVEF